MKRAGANRLLAGWVGDSRRRPHLCLTRAVVFGGATAGCMGLYAAASFGAMMLTGELAALLWGLLLGSPLMVVGSVLGFAMFFNLALFLSPSGMVARSIEKCL